MWELGWTQTDPSICMLIECIRELLLPLFLILALHSLMCMANIERSVAFVLHLQKIIMSEVNNNGIDNNDDDDDTLLPLKVQGVFFLAVISKIAFWLHK